MLTDGAVKALEKQQYRIVGDHRHSAVKVCGWTKNMIKGLGGCYKLKFYGIMSHQCMQMTTSISCANRCSFCWRGYKAPVSKEWKWGVDEPQAILDGALLQQEKLLNGFGGNPKAIVAAYKASKTVKHVALSLTGEPIIYPRMNELLKLFNEAGISTFLVTNAQYPDQIRDLNPVTQLYISVDAPNKELLKEIDVPLFDDYWERLNQSLEHLAQKKQRTTIRLTMIKGMNDIEPENYAALIKKGDADFIEVKGYMHVGASQERLNRSCMPLHEEVVAFAKTLEPYLQDYEMFSEHKPSRVVCFAKKKFKKDDGWYTWIDFPRYEELSTEGNDFSTDEYMKKTPKNLVGIQTESVLEKVEGEEEFVSVSEVGDEEQLE
ncbi:MAG: 4-demethylwyosine synthase TYW1 [Nanoarchaeota archaeon]|nr:4-demethylwyosine synthase TYW1 [Nanoarchaeota archaeon]